MPELSLTPGHCKVCGEPTHQILFQHAADGPLPGYPLRVGGRLSGTEKVSMLLSDGSWADLVLHIQCVPSDSEALVALWGEMIEATAFEADNYWHIKGQARVDGEKSDEIDAAVERQAVKIASLTPLELVEHRRG